MSDSIANTALWGVATGLGAAFLWALSTSLWKPSIMRHGARAMTLFKCATCTVYLWITTWWIFGPSFLDSLVTGAGAAMMLSGVIGLAVGDTLLFASMRWLGVQPATVMLQLSPLWSALVGLLLFQEKLGVWQYAAVPVVSLGVTLVIRGRVMVGAGERARDRRFGILAGLASSLLNAVGFLIAKRALTPLGEVWQGDDPVATALAASTLRMTAATGALFLMALLSGQFARWVAPLVAVRRHGRELFAVFVGAYVGVFLSQLSLAYVPASVTVCLCSTTPLFLLPMAVWLLHERYRWIAVVGTILALAGIVLLTVGGPREAPARVDTSRSQGYAAEPFGTDRSSEHRTP